LRSFDDDAMSIATRCCSTLGSDGDDEIDGRGVPEPVPHRGEDLARWVCQQDESCRDNGLGTHPMQAPRSHTP
jgi:hypothetical protein